MYELSLALPAISGVLPDYGWHAPWTRSVDDLPFIGPHRNYPHHLFALGLGANLSPRSWRAGSSSAPWPASRTGRMNISASGRLAARR